MEPGQIFEGKYRIVKMLGQGGMSKVYLAENMKLGTLWTIKEIHKNSQSKIDLLVEPNILKKLNHPSLPRIFDIVEKAESLIFIMDYIEGTSLDKELEAAGRFSESTVTRWAMEICEVLVYLHGQKPNPIIYRDLKPSNIILTKEGVIKLIDFGIAREYKGDSDNDTIYIGTRGYAAPEQYGWGQTDGVTDIYSLGVTLNHLLTGKSPNETTAGKGSGYFSEKGLSHELRHIIDRCTKLNPEDRYQSAVDVLHELEELNDTFVDAVPGRIGVNPIKNSAKRPSFKKLVLTVWDNPEFGCEMGYIIARLTDLEVFLADLDLMAPSADLHLNVPKYPGNVVRDSMLPKSGLDIVMDSIDKNALTADILAEAAARRKELKNLHILTGNYSMENYEYFKDDSLIKLIDKAYQSFDVTILLVNKSIYDSYTLISLVKSDYNIAALQADTGKLREFNRYLLFLKDKQGIPVDKTKFVAFEHNFSFQLGDKLMAEITGQNYLGAIGCSDKRVRYRNLKTPFARHMEDRILKGYTHILAQFNIVPKAALFQKIRAWSLEATAFLRAMLGLAGEKGGRRLKGDARGKYAS